MKTKRLKTSRILEWIVTRPLSREETWVVSGDLKEIFWDIHEEEGRLKALFWIFGQLFTSTPHFVRDSIYWRLMMIGNYLKVAFRTIYKQKLNSVLNVFGLAVALACSMLIFLHVRHELSFESGFSKADQIHRVWIESKYGDTWRHWAVGPIPMGPMMKDEIPEVESVTRFSAIGELVMNVDDGSEIHRFKELDGLFADPSVSDMFDLRFIKGDASKALTDAETIVLTTSMAKKYFGDEDALGKSIHVETYGNLPLRVTGIVEDMPDNTHLQFDFLISLSTFIQFLTRQGATGMLESRTWKVFYTYVQLSLESDPVRVEEKIADFRTRFHASMPDRVENFRLQPIKRIHLHSDLEQEMSANSDIAYVYIFVTTALLILLVASVNFINIMTAQAFKRIKEVGVRKVLGAQKSQLIRQFLWESFILAIQAAILAILLFYLALPLYSQLTGMTLTLSQLFSVSNLLIYALIVLIIVLIAGLYPSLFMSRFQPTQSIKGAKDPKSSVSLVRKGLVVLQFVISIFMIFGTITIYRQLTFFKEKDLGFDKERIMVVPLYGDMRRSAISNQETLKRAFTQFAPITQVSMTSNLPGQRFSVEHFRPEGTDPEQDIPTVRVMRVDENFLKTMNIPLVEGRDFHVSQSDESQFLLSEMAVDILNIENPIGKTGQGYSGQGQVVGVFQDFHFASLRNQIEPLVLQYLPGSAGYLLIKYQSQRLDDVVGFTREKLQEMHPGFLLDYSFIDQRMDRLYRYEDRLGELFKLFAALAIFISCLGLFGLSAYAAEVRVKEVGVRKVLGAKVSGIVLLLSREFLKWVLVANVIAWPLGYLAMTRWLEGFAYRTPITIWTFVLSGSLSIVVAILTVSYQSGKAAVTNPVNCLRYE